MATWYFFLHIQNKNTRQPPNTIFPKLPKKLKLKGTWNIVSNGHPIIFVLFCRYSQIVIWYYFPWNIEKKNEKNSIGWLQNIFPLKLFKKRNKKRERKYEATFMFEKYFFSQLTSKICKGKYIVGIMENMWITHKTQWEK